MAKVEMDLSELDALRDSLKELQIEKKRLIKEIDENNIKHAKEIDDLKKNEH